MAETRLYCKETGVGTGDLVRHKWQGWSGTVRNIARANVPERYETGLIDSRRRTEFILPRVVIPADVERDDSGRMESVSTMELELMEDESNE